MMFGLIGILCQIIQDEIMATTLLLQAELADLASQDIDDISSFLHSVAVVGDDPIVTTFSPPLTKYIKRVENVNNDNYITVTNSTGNTITNFGSGDFTFRFWVWHSVGSATTETLATIIDNRPNGSSPTGWFAIGINATTKQLQFVCQHFTLSSYEVLPYTWHFIQVTRETGVTSLYVDTKLQSFNAHSQDILDFNNFKVFRNAFEGTTSYPQFRGYLADLAVDNDAVEVELPSSPLTSFVKLDLMSLNPAMWYDANDFASLTIVSGAVSQWNDKSGNNRHLTTGSSAVRPNYVSNGLNLLPTLLFDATDDVMGVSTTGINSQSDFSFYAVFQFETLGAWSLICGFRSGVNAESTGTLLLQRMSTDLQLGAHNTGVADTRIKVDVNNLLIPRIATIGRNGGTNGNGGTVTVTATDPTSNYLTTATQTWNSSLGSFFQIGGRQQSGTAFSSKKISEVIVLPNSLASETRQLVEGYLAWKWNIVSGLPSDHPYKKNKVVLV